MQTYKDKLGKASITVEQGYWNINKDYNKLIVVEKEGTFGTFLSRKPVPAGTPLTNRTYWIPFSSLKEEIVIAYQQWVNRYGGIIESETAILNGIQQVMNDVYTHLPQGIYVEGNIDCVEHGSEDDLVLSFGTTNNKEGNFSVYVNNSLYGHYDNIKTKELIIHIAEDTNVKVECTQNGYTFIGSWNVAILYSCYVGYGLLYQDVFENDEFKIETKIDISDNYVVNADVENGFIFICVPKDKTIFDIKMSGFEIPMENPIIVANSENIEYKIYKSINSYEEGNHVIYIGNYVGDLSQEIDELLTILTTIKGNGEDIIVDENKELKFADRFYMENNPNEMGYIILRKNKSFEEQIAGNSNTIFEIRYDFELTTDITMPANCVLKFNGGKLSGTHRLTGVNTIIDANLVHILNTTIIIDGTWNNHKVFPEWFGGFADNSNIDCTPILYKLLNFNSVIQFSKGNYYFSEFYTHKEGIKIIGTGKGLSIETYFVPYENNQRYIIKLGGGADDFGTDNNRCNKIAIEHIAFSSTPVYAGSPDWNHNRVIVSNDENNPYNCGLLVIDVVKNGTFDLNLSNVLKCPALFIGYSFELIFDNIICYSSHTKSDCPIIALGSQDGDISATYIKTLMVESFTGNIIRCLNSNVRASEFKIETIYVEGTLKWEGGIAIKDYTWQYFLEDRETKIAEYNSITKHPLFDINGSCIICVNTLYMNALAEKWTNKYDEDETPKAYSIVSINGDTKDGAFTVNNVILDHVPFFYIEDNFQSTIRSGIYKLFIGYLNGGSGIINTGDHNGNGYPDSSELFNLNTYVKKVVGNNKKGIFFDVEKSDYVTFLPYIKIEKELFISSKNMGLLVRDGVSNNNGGLKSSYITSININSSYFDNLPSLNKATLPNDLIYIDERGTFTKTLTGDNNLDDYPIFASNILSDDFYQIRFLAYTKYNGSYGSLKFQVRYFNIDGVEDETARITYESLGNLQTVRSPLIQVPKKDGYSFNLYQLHFDYNSTNKYFCSIAFSSFYIFKYIPTDGTIFPYNRFKGLKFNNNDVSYEYVDEIYGWLRSMGTTSQRPVSAPDGFRYLDTTLQMEIISTGGMWIDNNGHLARKHIGIFGDRPTADTPSDFLRLIGFPYFATDKGTYGLQIYGANDGNDHLIWVDGAGNVVN